MPPKMGSRVTGLGEKNKKWSLPLQEGDGHVVTLRGVDVMMDVQGWRKNRGGVDFNRPHPGDRDRVWAT